MLVTQGDITYLQVVGSMMIIVLCSSFLRKGEELKAPRHASAAATRDGRLLGIKASAHHLRHIAVTCGKLPSRVAAALAWRGALSSSPSLIENIQNNNYHTIYEP